MRTCAGRSPIQSQYRPTGTRRGLRPQEFQPAFRRGLRSGLRPQLACMSRWFAGTADETGFDAVPLRARRDHEDSRGVAQIQAVQKSRAPRCGPRLHRGSVEPKTQKCEEKEISPNLFPRLPALSSEELIHCKAVVPFLARSFVHCDAGGAGVRSSGLSGKAKIRQDLMVSMRRQVNTLEWH